MTIQFAGSLLGVFWIDSRYWIAGSRTAVATYVGERLTVRRMDLRESSLSRGHVGTVVRCPSGKGIQVTGFEGSLYRRADAGYEQARAAAVWNGKKPRRTPEVIAVANTRADIPRAIALARDESLSIGIRSGGHSWVGNALRDGGLLLDLSRLKDIQVNPDARTAIVEPGVHVRELVAALARHDLYFPTGHCPTVGLAGFLLGGGAGLNSYVVGPAAYSMSAVDVVTAQGESLHASDTEHTDIMWAARGSGPGFFAAVSQMHLDLRPAPGVVAWTMQVHPLSAYDKLIPWYMGVTEQLQETGCPALLIASGNPLAGTEDPVLTLVSYVFADDLADAEARLAPLSSAPDLSSALLRQSAQPTSVEDLLNLFDLLYPEGYRYLSDNVWLADAKDSTLWRATRSIIDSLPTARSSVWLIPGTRRTHPNAAFSLTAEMSLQVYAVYDDSADDSRMSAWHSTSMESIENFSIGGGYVGDSNLFDHPMAILDPPSAKRLEALRAQYDPDGRFYSYPHELPMARV